MSSEHTPGPWHYRIGGNGYCKVLAGNRHVATTWTDGRIDVKAVAPLPVEDNARLIAAAPDLLAALESLLQESMIDAGEQCDMRARQEQARAAIVKARGRE